MWVATQTVRPDPWQQQAKLTTRRQMHRRNLGASGSFRGGPWVQVLALTALVISAATACIGLILSYASIGPTG